MTARSPQSGGPAYRLGELGWLQFERLCALLLTAEAGMAELRWSGSADQVRSAAVDGPLAMAGAQTRLEGPAQVAVAWLDPRRPAQWRAEVLAQRLAALGADADRRLLVLANVDRAAAAAALGPDTEILGEHELSVALDRHPSVRAALPSVLGLRDLSDLIAEPARARSSLQVEEAAQLARVFWPTHAYARARQVLADHRFVVLTGPPEMGKTAIARMLALAQMTDGWEAHECHSPEQLWRVLEPSRRQVFIADDAFGSTEYRPDAAERWAGSLGRLLTMLDADHWLVWTSRPAPLRAGLARVRRERHAERFPQPGQILVDASDLELAERTLILFRHAKARGLNDDARAVIRTFALTIVEHPHFTPERVRRVVNDRLRTPLRTVARDGADRVRELLESELATPTEAMRTSLSALGPEHRDLLYALLDAPDGLIDERELAATVRRHHRGGLSQPPAALVDRLTDHFLRVTPLGIGWVHPSWRDLLIEELRADPVARGRFLGACGAYGVLLALSAQGGAAGERSCPLLVHGEDWTAVSDRLTELCDELEDHGLAQLLLALPELPARISAEQRWRAQQLAVDVLTAVAARWDARQRPIPTTLLGHWYALRAWSGQAVTRPELEVTWAELYPGSAFEDRADLIRAEEWLTLLRTLVIRDLGGLDALGFPTDDRGALARLVVALPTAPAPEDRGLTEGILGRIIELSSGVTEAAARDALRRLTAGAAELDTRWWVPEDLPVPPSDEPAASASAEFTSADVRRVLADL